MRIPNCVCLALKVLIGLQPVSAQSPGHLRIRFSLPEKTVETFALAEHRVKAEAGLEYFWWKGQRIQTTTGGVAGAVLDGQYAEYDPEGRLMTKGIMKKGLRTGEWRTWDGAGKLRDITHWRKGKMRSKRMAVGGEGITTKKMERRSKQEERAAVRASRKAERKQQRQERIEKDGPPPQKDAAKDKKKARRSKAKPDDRDPLPRKERMKPDGNTPRS